MMIRHLIQAIADIDEAILSTASSSERGSLASARGIITDVLQRRGVFVGTGKFDNIKPLAPSPGPKRHYYDSDCSCEECRAKRLDGSTF